MKSHKGLKLMSIALIAFAIGLWPIGAIIFPVSFIFLAFDIKQNYYNDKINKDRR